MTRYLTPSGRKAVVNKYTRLVDAQPLQCRWPYQGKPADPLCCGEQVVVPLPYCAVHTRKAYVRVKA